MVFIYLKDISLGLDLDLDDLEFNEEDLELKEEESQEKEKEKEEGQKQKEDLYLEKEVTEANEENEKIEEESENVNVNKVESLEENSKCSVFELNETTEKDAEKKFKLEYISKELLKVPDRRLRTSDITASSLEPSLRKTGLLQPVTVVPLQDGSYAIVDGLVRYYACLKTGITNIPCVINCKAQLQDIPLLEAIYNQHKSYTMREVVTFIQEYLEKDRNIYNANQIEYLLQLDTGDYSKLKDVLSSGNEAIIEDLLNDKLSIARAYKKVESERKKISKSEKEKQQAERAYANEALSLEDQGQLGKAEDSLSDEEVAEQLTLKADDIKKDNTEESLDTLVEEGKEIEGYEPHKQDYKHREILSPELRKAALARDKNCCQACGAEGQEFVDVLDEHHIQEVYLGGKDEIDNLITLCTVCHKLVHLYARGELHIRPESELAEGEKKRFKVVVKLGNIIREGVKAKGMKRKELKEKDKAETIGRTKPGTGQQAS